MAPDSTTALSSCVVTATTLWFAGSLVPGLRLGMLHEEAPPPLMAESIYTRAEPGRHGFSGRAWEPEDSGQNN